MLLPYLLVFCRMVIGLVFVLSSVGKVRDMASFAETVARFRILSKNLSSLTAWLFLACEFAVVMLMIIGGSLLAIGFLLAVVLLSIFSGALLSVLVRHIETSCTCFGTSKKPVSTTDIWRNGGFILCALAASVILFGTKQTQYSLSILEWITLGLSSVVFVTLWLQLGDIMQLFDQK